MADTKFYRGSDATHTGITTDGCLSFNTNRGTIHLGDGSSATQFLNRIGVLTGDNKIGTADVTSESTTDGTSYGYKYNLSVPVPGIVVHIGECGYSNTPNSNYGACVYNVDLSITTSSITSTVTLSTNKRAYNTTSTPPMNTPRFKYTISYIPCG